MEAEYLQYPQPEQENGKRDDETHRHGELSHRLEFVNPNGQPISSLGIRCPILPADNERSQVAPENPMSRRMEIHTKQKATTATVEECSITTQTSPQPSFPMPERRYRYSLRSCVSSANRKKIKTTMSAAVASDSL